MKNTGAIAVGNNSHGPHATLVFNAAEILFALDAIRQSLERDNTTKNQPNQDITNKNKYPPDHPFKTCETKLKLAYQKTQTQLSNQKQNKK